MLNVNVSSPVLWQTTVVQWAASFSFEGWTFPPQIVIFLHYCLQEFVFLSCINIQPHRQGGCTSETATWSPQEAARSHWAVISRVSQWLSLSLVSLGFWQLVECCCSEGQLWSTNPGWVKSWNITSCLLTRLPFSRNSWHIYESPSFFPHPLLHLREVYFKGTLFRDISLEVSHSMRRAAACPSLIETIRTLHTENDANKLWLCNAKYITTFLALGAFSSCFPYNISGCFHSRDI